MGAYGGGGGEVETNGDGGGHGGETTWGRGQEP